MRNILNRIRRGAAQLLAFVAVVVGVATPAVLAEHTGIILWLLMYVPVVLLVMYLAGGDD